MEEIPGPEFWTGEVSWLKNTKYLNAFLDESRELLERLDAKLVELEASGGGVDELFRLFHTLKGSSASMGLEQVALLSHRLEDVLGRIREGKLAISPELVDFLLSGADGIRATIAQETGQGPVFAKYQELIDKAKAILGLEQEQLAHSTALPKIGLELSATEEERAKKSKAPLWRLTLRIAEDCSFKGARALLLLRALGQLGKVHKYAPSSSAFHEDNYDGSLTIIFSSDLDLEELEKQLSAEVLTEVAVHRLEQYTRKPPQADVNGKQANSSIRVETSKLDRLLNLAGELVIGQAQLDRISQRLENDHLKQVAAKSQRLVLDLQDAVLKVRMVPLESVFGRFPRLVRDLARELGKKVELSLEGTATEVDRTVAEELPDPLVHLLRNAIDHGIESPQIRRAQGKSETGRLSLRAAQEGESVTIIVEDDGAGIDPAKIRASALKHGLMAEEQLAEMSDHELLNLVFFPGLSTVKQVTGVSGRGVGMDVVRSTIESLGGVVSVESASGEGTRTTIRLPLTLAIVRALLVQVGPEVYAIPLNQIMELVNIPPSEIQNVRGRECFLYEEKVVGLYDLGQELQVPDYSPDPASNRKVVLLDCGQRIIGCRVGQYLGQENIVVKAVGGYLPQLPYLGGATILGDGQVVLILDGRNLVA